MKQRIRGVRTKTYTKPGCNIVYMHLFKPGTFIERGETYACNAVRNLNACKAGTTIERIITNACYVIRDFYACKAFARYESIILYFCNPLWNYKFCQQFVIQTQFMCIIQRI